ncbi:MAG: restriction endonuclease subunit S [Pseudomonadota bacterium]
MKTELKNIASVQMGYSFRSRIEAKGSGAVAVIQMKDLTDDNRVDCCGLTQVDMELPKAHHIVRPGDLFFRSRGLTAASAILADDPGVAVVSAPLLRIRVDEQVVLPEYLNWFISQASAQSYLASRAIGTAQKMITKDALENLEVFIPSLERQVAVTALAALADEEQRLLNRLAIKRRQYTSTILMRLAQGE